MTEVIVGTLIVGCFIALVGWAYGIDLIGFQAHVKAFLSKRRLINSSRNADNNPSCNPKATSEPTTRLRVEALEILLAANDAQDASVHCVELSVGIAVKILDSEKFTGISASGREAAILRAAIQELLDFGLLTHHADDVLRITEAGYGFIDHCDGEAA